MRWHALAVAVLFARIGEPIATDDIKEAIMKDMKALAATWTVVSAERDGKKLSDEQIAGITFNIDGTGRASLKKGDHLIFDGTIEVDPSKTPKALDATQTSEGENQGKTTLSIYEVEGDTFKICSAGPGKDRPAEFSTKLGSGHFYRVFKREKK
jgi:uncharacterized protein (TIGR03067 family)